MIAPAALRLMQMQRTGYVFWKALVLIELLGTFLQDIVELLYYRKSGNFIVFVVDGSYESYKMLTGNFGEVLIWWFGKLGKDRQFKKSPI